MKHLNLRQFLAYTFLSISFNVHYTEQKVVDSSVFETNLCDEKCPNEQTHTMCIDIAPLIPSCDPFSMTTFEKGTDSEPLMKLLVNGHNGLRNRIADRLKVPNMLELTWDKKLANMAENFLRTCPIKTMDSCSAYPETFKEEDTFAGFYKNNHTAAQIVQNVYSERGSYYPYKFIERVVRTWYFEKEGMREPVYTAKDGVTYGRLSGENNFTHFASPLTYRFGCGMATYFDSYHLVCNYYPFYRTVTNVLFFSSGPPVTSCPAKFPMMDDMYKSLCTADTDSFFDGYTETRLLNKFIFFVSILLWYTIF